MDKSEVREIVRETIEELIKRGLLRSYDDLAYPEAATMLKVYYDEGEEDKLIQDALDSISDDPYYKIIPLYFSYGYTLEKLAEIFNVEVSTISRNKKRLCLMIYKKIQ